MLIEDGLPHRGSANRGWYQPPAAACVVCLAPQATIELLSDEWAIGFFATAINFLHTEFVQSSPHYEASQEAKVSGARLHQQG